MAIPVCKKHRNASEFMIWLLEFWELNEMPKNAVSIHRKKKHRLQKVSLHSRDIGASYGIKIQASSFLQQVWCLHYPNSSHSAFHVI